MEQSILNNYKRWLEKATDADVAQELKAIENNDEKIEDAFYRELEFGTGGLRGVIGAGTNRMNVYTVAKASQGLANYVVNNFAVEDRKIAVSYDSRIKSDVFSKVASGVFAANGIKVYIYDQLMPTPCLSFAVRDLKCAAGIMVTASHNPSKYNGYKAYGADGCQITNEVADEVSGYIDNIDVFDGVKTMDFDKAMNEGLIQYTPAEVYTRFVENVKAESLLQGEKVNKDVAIIYTPLNGSGLKPVLRTLTESGYTNVTVVKEQEQPDGNFPTCPYPNPEIKEAMALGMQYAKDNNADLLVATDPDCDRVGIAVKNQEGEFVLLTGNQTGMLLLDYICQRRIALSKMPQDPVVVKTIVTTDMADRIAQSYGVRTINILTGFKYIGEQIALLENEGKEDSYILGFEESYGYLSGTYVRDKDAVNGTFLICEMFAYYQSKGIGLLDRLNELYSKFGYCLNSLHSYQFEGSAGFVKMKNIMSNLKKGIATIGGKKVEKTLDYSLGIDSLPKSDVVKFLLEDNCSVVVRPSGTEPKMKVYISVSAKTQEMAAELEKAMHSQMDEYLA